MCINNFRLKFEETFCFPILINSKYHKSYFSCSFNCFFFCIFQVDARTTADTHGSSHLLREMLVIFQAHRGRLFL